MKKIVCDLCGESDFVKLAGMFECQVCGAKYTIEEARGMFVEVPDEPGSSKSTQNVEAPTNESYEDETPVAVPKGPTIVRKVVVGKPAGQTHDSQAAKRIISQVKKPGEAAPEAQAKPKSGQPAPVKKVVVMRPTSVKPTPAAAPKKVQPTPKQPDL